LEASFINNSTIPSSSSSCTVVVDFSWQHTSKSKQQPGLGTTFFPSALSNVNSVTSWTRQLFHPLEQSIHARRRLLTACLAPLEVILYGAIASKRFCPDQNTALRQRCRHRRDQGPEREYTRTQKKLQLSSTGSSPTRARDVGFLCEHSCGPRRQFINGFELLAKPLYDLTTGV
jgi:hypothetical protein